MASWTAKPFEISSYDNPETIRFRKYATGTHLVVHGPGVEADLTPKEAVWQRGETKYSKRPYLEQSAHSALARA
jgi:hypothetical protein